MIRLALFTVVTALLAPALPPAHAHEGEHFAAGEPGNPKRPSKTVTITAVEKGKQMLFEPSHIDVKKGEQIKFVIWNEGSEDHEFVLATPEANRKHAQLMKKYPNMEHADPNAVRVGAYTYKPRELLWKFTKKGTFEYGCLISGHYEAGMHGTVTVK